MVKKIDFTVSVNAALGLLVIEAIEAFERLYQTLLGVAFVLQTIA